MYGGNKMMKKAFRKAKTLLKEEMRKRFVNVLYGVWCYMTTKHGQTKGKKKYIWKSFEMLLWIKVIKVKWTDKEKNGEVLTRKKGKTIYGSSNKEKPILISVYAA